MTPNLAYVMLGAYEGDKAEELHALSDAVMTALQNSVVALARCFIACGMGDRSLLEAIEKHGTACFDPLFTSQSVSYTHLTLPTTERV